MAATDLTEFMTRINRVLDEDDIGELIEMVFSEENVMTVRLCSMDIYQTVCARLQDGHIHKVDYEKFSCLESILDHLSRTCSPKEMLLAGMEQLESLTTDSHFGVICRQLKSVLIRLPAKRAPEYAFMTCLDLMIKYVRKLPRPPEYALDGADTCALAENCSTSQRHIDVCNSCLVFIQPFVSEIMHHKHRSDESNNIADRGQQATLLANFLLLLFEYPIGRLHWSFASPHLNIKALQLTRDAFELIGALCPDYIWKLPVLCSNLKSDIMETESVERTSSLGLGVLAYCYYFGALDVVLDDSVIEIDCNERLVCTHVYSGEHQLDVYMTAITEMCQRCKTHSSDNMVTHRCIKLIDIIFRQVPALALNVDWLTSQRAQDLMLSLIGLVFACSTPESSTAVVKLIEQVLVALYAQARLAFVRLGHVCINLSFLFETRESSLASLANDENQVVMLLGWIVDWLRAQLCSESASMYEPNDTRSVLNVVFALESGECSDLVADMALHSAACILFTRLAMMDEQQRSVSVITLRQLNSDYLQPLRRAIQLSRAHYELELTNIDKNLETLDKKADLVKDNTKMQFLSMCITKLDLLNSQLTRAIQLASRFKMIDM